VSLATRGLMEGPLDTMSRKSSMFGRPRLWRHRVRKVAHGYTLQVPCRPCPHRDMKTGEALHSDGVRQVRVVNSAWSREDAEKALAAYLLGVEQEQ
jgi:hypothetical protein